MQDTRVYDYMIRSGTMSCHYAGSDSTIPVSIGVTPRQRKGEIVAHCVLSAAAGGLRVEVILDNDTGLPVRIDSLSLDTTILLPKQTPYFCNGYQSWSRSGLSDSRRRLRRPPVLCNSFLRRSGDYDFVRYSSSHAHSWTYTYFDAPLGYTLIASLDESIAFTRIRYTRDDSRKGTTIQIEKDCEGLFYEPVAKTSGNRPEHLKILDVFIATGDESGCWNRYFDLYYSLNRENGRMNRSKPAFAWDSAYAMFDTLDEVRIRSVLREYAGFEIPLDYFIIGSGYETALGDWTLTGQNFEGGMQSIARKIKSFGYKPGISFSPFICSSKSLLYRERRELLVKDGRGKVRCIGRNRNLGGKLYLLDLYNPEGEKYFKKCIKTLIDEWGMEFIRADMLFAAGLNSGNEARRTRAQAMEHALLLLRDYAGAIPVDACGVTLGNCFGLFEYCSVTPDLSSGWHGRASLFCRNSLREKESTLHAVITAINRRHLDSRAFSSDPGSFTLRKYRSGLTAREQDILFRTCKIFGGLFYGSDSIGAYNADTLEKFREAAAGRPSRRHDREIAGVLLKDDSILVSYTQNGIECEESIALKTDLYL
ncbi:MAG: alpha-galactosidase [Saccharofermentanales bacterium]